MSDTGDLRDSLIRMLGIPPRRCPLSAEKRGVVEHNGVLIEKWVFTAEPGSRVPALLYRPLHAREPMAAIVLTYGHGGSKSSWQYQYAGLLYARLGLACLAMDPLGEEERNIDGQMGTRAHDPKLVSDRADAAGRLIMGKFVFDAMRGIDFLVQRDDIDPTRIGVAGNSLGGAVASWVVACEPRLRMALVCGWAYDDVTLPTKWCTRLPNERMRRLCNWVDFATLPAPECAVLLMNGDADPIIDRGDRDVWARTRAVVERASKLRAARGMAGPVETWFEPGGGHRPYFLYKRALEWIHHCLGTPGWSLSELRALPTVNSGAWCDRHAVRLEKLYGTPLHQRGATLPDLGLSPIPRAAVAVLRHEEIGRPEYTLEGWLNLCERLSANAGPSTGMTAEPSPSVHP